jgi:HTH-type transcriptional regulator, sugar sensing transcriptional regulator
MYETQLKELGLTDNEVRIYLLLLKKGSLNPYEVAENLGLHRGYTYDALERMQEKEVVNHILKNNKKFFQATSPENIVELLKLKLESFQEIVPKLKQLAEATKEKTKVEVHKGKRVYRTLLKDIIATVKKKDTVLLIGVDEKTLIEEVEPIYLKQYFTIIKERSIKEKVIMKKGNKKYTISNVTHRFLDEKYIGNVEQIIYNNKVAIFISGDPHNLIVIDNSEVSKTYKKQFELLWSIAKPLNKVISPDIT